MTKGRKLLLLPPCYIAAPYAAATPAERLWNVERAELLGGLAILCGQRAVVVHRRILIGEWGADEDLVARNIGKAATLNLCRDAVVRGSIWALQRDDESYSEGTATEWALRTQQPYNATRPCLTGTWLWWRAHFYKHGHYLLPRWEQLRQPPTAAAMSASRGAGSSSS